MRPGGIWRTGVVLSTYEQPEYLRLALAGYGCQSCPPHEILVADDGSGEATARVVAVAAEAIGIPIVHVLHPDRGFRKTLALNRAILASTAEYLIFSDGDCIPNPHFVERHLALARRGRFVSGGYLKLPPEVTGEVTVEAVREGRVFDPAWLRARGWRPGRKALRVGRGPSTAALLDRLTPTRATWNGHNASTFRDHLIQVNGFDLDMEWGGEDRALGERLVHLGVRGIQARFRTPVVHLHHGHPYVRDEALARNRAIQDRIRRRREVRARLGLAEIEEEDGVRIRRFEVGG